MKQRLALDIKKGDYVLATKYDDGDPQDQWAVGFYDGITSQHYIRPRYDVIDSKGTPFRGNGFRRIEKISAKRGEFLLRHVKEIELSGKSVWYFVKVDMEKHKC